MRTLWMAARRAPAHALVVVLVLASVVLTGRPAVADPAVMGRVTDGVAGIPGAFVAVIGANGQRTAVAGADGSYAVGNLPDGTYTVRAQAPGYAVGQTTVTVAGSAEAPPMVLVGSGATLSSAKIFGGQIGTVLSGGSPGIFYATTSVIPQLFRTTDYGGSWSPVTNAIDDPERGLSAASALRIGGGSVAVSGQPGELAVRMDDRIYYSDDFGITWRAVAGRLTYGGGERRELYWGHAGATSVLLAVDGITMYRVDMSQASPTLVAMSDGYGDPADAVAVANGADAPWVAAVTSAGVLRMYRLTATDPPAETGTPLSGLPGGADLIRLGGTSDAGHPPSAALVFSHSEQKVALAAKPSAADSFTTASANTAVPGDMAGGCGTNAPGTKAVASLAPSSGGDAAEGTIGACLARVHGAGETVGIEPIFGINNNTGFAFDAGYGIGGNRVTLSGDGNRGIVKSAAVDNDGVPVFPTDRDATAGFDADSGGISVNGFDVAVVKDATYGPAANQYATMLSMSGGGLGYASDDGGVTTRVTVRKGGSSVAWWTGAGSTQWLVYGHMGGGPLLSAHANWTSESAPLTGPNLADSGDGNLHYPGEPGWGAVRALAGVPQGDALFVGMGGGGAGGMGADPNGALAGSVTRVGLGLDGAGAPRITTNVQLAAAQVDGAVNALAYCPASGSADNVADVLFVGVDTGTQGTVVRITDATGGSPAGTVVATADAPVREIRVDCASGTVWAGTATTTGGAPSVGLLRSTNGGTSFAAAPTGGLPGNVQVTALAMNPANASELLLAANHDGYLARTVDGGATWTTVNDPQSGGRNFTSEGVSVLAFPPAPTVAALGGVASAFGVAAAATASGQPALVGTGGGLFTAAVGRVVKGLFFATNRSGHWPTATRVPATDAASATPVLTVDTAGKAWVVYRGGTGLFLATRTAAGMWSAPTRITGTVSGDAQPTLRRGGDGALHVAFTRAGGVYYTRMAAGSWSTPGRLPSGAAGDTNPSLALDGAGKVHIVYRRPTAPAGLYHATNRTGQWVRTRVPGTGAGDRTPAIATYGNTVQLAFARDGAGIYVAAASGGVWATPVRRTAVGGDGLPTLARDAAGKSYVAFRRTGSSAGVYLITNRTGSWSSPGRVAGTGKADGHPRLVAASNALHLAFARTGGGVYVTTRTLAGSWATPARRTRSTLDTAPALAVDGSQKDHLVVDRG